MVWRQAGNEVGAAVDHIVAHVPHADHTLGRVRAHLQQQQQQSEQDQTGLRKSFTQVKINWHIIKEYCCTEYELSTSTCAIYVGTLHVQVHAHVRCEQIWRDIQVHVHVQVHIVR